MYVHNMYMINDIIYIYIYVTWFAFSKENIFLYCELGDKFVRDSQIRQNSQILELA